ncbi:MAG TPA: hypothetical protein VFO27_07860 [Bryobacteraceae bacterium]|nr:hypothetical protein [Bryobacteraceae bacterium]
MRTLIQARKSIALVCLAAFLLAALVPVASGLPFAILAPLWLFLAAVVCVSLVRPADDGNSLPVPVFSILPSRAPPVA